MIEIPIKYSSANQNSDDDESSMDIFQNKESKDKTVPKDYNSDLSFQQKKVSINVQSKNYSKMFLDSIYSVRNFYKKCGFIEEGEIFQRVGIDHIRMSLTF